MNISKTNEDSMYHAVLSELKNWYIVNKKFLTSKAKITVPDDDLDNCLYILYARSLNDILSNNSIKIVPIDDNCGITIINIKEMKMFNMLVKNLGTIYESKVSKDIFIESINAFLHVIGSLRKMLETDGKQWHIS